MSEGDTAMADPLKEAASQTLLLDIHNTIPTCYLRDGNIFRYSRKISFHSFSERL